MSRMRRFILNKLVDALADPRPSEEAGPYSYPQTQQYSGYYVSPQSNQPSDMFQGYNPAAAQVNSRAALQVNHQVNAQQDFYGARSGPSNDMSQLLIPSPPPPPIDARRPSPYPPPTAPSQMPPAIARGPNYGINILYDPGPTSRADIVFVHGLTGNSYDTWLHKQTKVHWPSQVLPRDLEDCRILSFGFDADIVNFWNPASRARLGTHAEDMVIDLSDRRARSKTAERKIFFVCHSLGGLVVQHALSHSRNSYERHIRQVEQHVHGILFLGTPHHGADLASWARFGTNLASIVRPTNNDIVAVLRPGSEMLHHVQNNFHTILRHRKDEQREIEITCFFEVLPVAGIVIVPEHSARMPGYSGRSIHANHMDMTKFPNNQDPGYNVILGELLRWRDTLPQQTSSPMNQAYGSSAPQAPGFGGVHDSDARAVFDASVALRATLKNGRTGFQQIAKCIERFDRTISAALSHHHATSSQAGVSDVASNCSTLSKVVSVASMEYGASFRPFVSGQWTSLIEALEKRMEQVRELRRMLSPESDENVIEAIFGGLNSGDFLIDISNMRA